MRLKASTMAECNCLSFQCKSITTPEWSRVGSVSKRSAMRRSLMTNASTAGMSGERTATGQCQRWREQTRKQSWRAGWKEEETAWRTIRGLHFARERMSRGDSESAQSERWKSSPRFDAKGVSRDGRAKRRGSIARAQGNAKRLGGSLRAWLTSMHGYTACDSVPLSVSGTQAHKSKRVQA